MFDQDDDAICNHLLLMLSSDDIELLAPHMARVSLSLRQPLEAAHETITSVYFLEAGLASLVASKHGGSTVEIGLFGRDGMTGTALLQGDSESPFDCFMQMSGMAMCISAADLQAALAKSVSLTTSLTRYARALGIQITYTALSSSQNKLEERLARWLLMVHDRVEGNTFSITHEFLAIMLGVRRPGVTVAIQLLESKSLIRSQRGEIVVKDRGGLMALTKGTYGPAEKEYERLTGISLGKSKPLPFDGGPPIQSA